MNELGTSINPVSSTEELRKVIKGRRDCIIYTKGILHLTDDIKIYLEISHIKLAAVGYLMHGGRK